MRITRADLDERRILAPALPALNRITATQDTVRESFRRGMVAAARRAAAGPVTRPRKVSGPARRLKRPATAQDNALRRLQRATAPREREIQRDILALLNATPGVYAWKAGSGLLPVQGGRRVRMGKTGVADVIGWVRVHRELGEWRRCANLRCLHPHVAAWLAVEVKRPNGKPATPAQLDFLARLRDAGSPLALVATSVDEVRRAVEAL